MTAVLSKQPSEAETFQVNLSDRLASGITLSSITSTTVSPTSLTIDQETIVSNVYIRFRAQSGASGTLYTITFVFVTSDGETKEVDVPFYVQDTSTGFATLVKPPLWLLTVGRRYLKYITNDLVPVGSEKQGIAQSDLDSAQNYAWRVLLSKFIGQYDVSGWPANPPHPLFEIWDLLASSYIVALVGQNKAIDDDQASSTARSWMSQADDLIRNIINPRSEADRMNLIKSDGTIQYKKSKLAIPKVLSATGQIFFPTEKSDTNAWGESIKGSVEEFVDNHCIKI